MRILLCHNNYVVHGGAEVFVHEVARVLKAKGHDVAYLASFEDDAESEWKAYFPKAVDYRGNKIGAVTSFPELVYSRRAKRAAREIIRDFKPDIAHTFAVYTKLTPSILDALGDAGVPVVSSFNDYKHICPNYKLYHHGHVCFDCQGKRFFHAVLNRCAHNSLLYSTANALESYWHRLIRVYTRNIHTFLFASEFMAHKTLEFWGPEKIRWDILRNPFDSTKYVMPQRAGDYALFFGRLIDEKGVDILVRAAAIAADVPVIIVGDGPQRAQLASLAAELGCENVTFAGPVWGAELDNILSGSRFVVVPSLWHENFPYVILQSFAMGKPVIGSNRGGIPELVGDRQRGVIYPARDAAALAAAMKGLYMDDTEVERLGRSAKEYADAEFNDEHFYSRLVEIYRRVLR